MDNGNDLRRALRALNKNSFGPNPLLSRIEIGDSKVSRADTLRKALLEALCEMGKGNPDKTSPQNCIQLKLVDGVEESKILKELNISRTELYRRIGLGLDQLGEILSRKGIFASLEKPRASNTPNIFSPPRTPAISLIGRKNTLVGIKKWLVEGNGKTLVVHGPPGIGKSALSIEMALDPDIRGYFPDGVAYIELGADPDLSFVAELCASGLEIPTTTDRLSESLQNRIRQKLFYKKALFIIDDVYSEEAFRFFDAITGPYCVVIATTRIQKLAISMSQIEKNKVLLDPLTDQESLVLFKALAPKSLGMEDLVGGFLNQLGGLPLSIVTSGKYIAQMMLRGSKDEVYDAVKNFVHATDIHSLGGLFDYCISRLSKDAQKLLTIIGSLVPKPVSISEELLFSITGASKQDLEELINSGFLTPVQSNRYTIHQSFHEMSLARLRVDPDRPAILRKFVDGVSAMVCLNRFDYPKLQLEYELINQALVIAQELGFKDLYSQISVEVSSFLRSRGLSDHAIHVLKESFEKVDAVKNPDLAGRISDELSQIYFREKNYPEAKDWALKVLDLLPNSSFVSRACEVISACYLVQGDSTTSEQYIKRAISSTQSGFGALDRFFLLSATPTLEVSELTKLDVVAKRIFTLWHQAVRFFREGNFEEAIKLSRESVATSRSFGDNKFLLQSLGHHSIVAYTIGPYEDSIRCAEESNKIVFSSNDDSAPQRGHAFSITYGGICQTLIGDYEGAMKSLKQASDFGKSRDSSDFLAWIYFGKASSAFYWKNFEEAYSYSQQALAFALQSASNDHIVSPLRACGYSAAALGRYDEAMAYLLQTEKAALELLTPQYAKMEIGILQWRRGETETAEKTLREVTNTLRGWKSWQFAVRAEFALAKLLWMKGDEQEASSLAREALTISTSLHDIRAHEIGNWIQAESEQKFEMIIDEFSGKA